MSKEDYLAINGFVRLLKSFTTYVLVGILMWILTTLTLKFGISLNIDIWIITAFNVVFYGIFKYVLYWGLNVFK